MMNFSSHVAREARGCARRTDVTQNDSFHRSLIIGRIAAARGTIGGGQKAKSEILINIRLETSVGCQPQEMGVQS